MLARISFDSGQKVSLKEKEEIELFLADEVSFDEMVRTKDGDFTTFYNWNHTYDKEEADNPESKKTLVFKCDIVQLRSDKEYLTDAATFMQKFPKIKIKMRGVGQSADNNLTNMINMVQEAERKFSKALESFDEKIEFNQKCNVHIGNLGLLNINQLGYANDYCTEALQEILNKGWRILAVCPQPDQRRPDYVLGRHDGDDKTNEVKCFQFN